MMYSSYSTSSRVYWRIVSLKNLVYSMFRREKLLYSRIHGGAVGYDKIAVFIENRFAMGERGYEYKKLVSISRIHIRREICKCIFLLPVPFPFLEQRYEVLIKIVVNET